MFSFYVGEHPECPNGRTKMILQINEECKAPCHTLSSSWHLLGLTDATLSCLPELLSESARLTSKPRLWLAVKIEADGNWLHITWVLQLKKVHSEKFKKFQSRNDCGHPYLSQWPSSRSVHCQRWEKGGKEENDWQKGGRPDGWLRLIMKDSLKYKESVVLVLSGGVVHGWSGIIVLQVSWVQGVCPWLWQPGRIN